MESRKTALKNLSAGKQWRSRHREQTCGRGERGGEGETCGSSKMETFITICKTDSQREFAVWLRKLNSGMGREVGGRFKSEGIYEHLWVIHVEV